MADRPSVKDEPASAGPIETIANSPSKSKVEVTEMPITTEDEITEKEEPTSVGPILPSVGLGLGLNIIEDKVEDMPPVKDDVLLTSEITGSPNTLLKNESEETAHNLTDGTENNTTAGSSEESANNSANATSAMDPSTLHYEGETCIYTDPTTKYQYEWDKTKNEWVAKAAATSYGYEGDTHTYTDPTDGTCYIWDKEKNAWFPKVDDDFLAQYQMNYGFTDPKVEAERAAEAERAREEKEKLEAQAAAKKRAPPKDPTWFELEEQHNTKVYVSNLPTDITEQEFIDLMQKCGMVVRDADTNRMKVKLYTEPGDAARLKGDALCTYIKVESVDLALKLLDGYELRGHRLSVERARFQMKGSYDPNLKPKKRRRKDKEKLKKQQEALFDWRPEKMRGERSKHERTVIIRNLFDAQIFEKDVGLILEYQQDMREECAKCGTVKKVVIYDRHAEGVAQVTFAEPDEADACILLLNGRWFGQRKITAETWDGKTKYKVAETAEETKVRLKKWEKYLEAEEKKKEGNKEAATSPSVGVTETDDGIRSSGSQSTERVELGSGMEAVDSGKEAVDSGKAAETDDGIRSSGNQSAECVELGSGMEAVDDGKEAVDSGRAAVDSVKTAVDSKNEAIGSAIDADERATEEVDGENSESDENSD